MQLSQIMWQRLYSSSSNSTRPYNPNTNSSTEPLIPRHTSPSPSEHSQRTSTPLPGYSQTSSPPPKYSEVPCVWVETYCNYCPHVQGKHSSIRCETRVDQGDYEIHNCTGPVNVVRKDEVHMGKIGNGLPMDECCPICVAMYNYRVRGYSGGMQSWDSVYREFRSWVTRVVNGREVRYGDEKG